MFKPAVPIEITQALEQKGYTLLIKGDAGTGKTTLSLELLSQAESKVYISSRITPSTLLKQFPWLHDEEITFIDATQTFVQEDSIASQIERALKFREMPGFLQKLYTVVKNKGGCPTVVIDSWDAIKSGILEDEIMIRRSESVLAEMVRYLKFNLILVVESKELYLDYISDGIVELRSEIYDNRRQRIVRIKKMRGVEINQPEYLFSLSSGRFKYFKSIPREIPFESTKSDIPVISNTDKRLFTCSKSLNEFFDYSLGKNTITLIEIGEGVGHDYLWLIIPTIINQLSQKCGIEILQKNLLFFDFAPTYNDPPEFTKLIRTISKDVDLEKVITELTNAVVDFAENREKENNIEEYNITVIFGSNKFENRFGVEGLKYYTEIFDEYVKLFRRSKMIYLAYYNQKLHKLLGHVVSASFKIERIYNTLVIYGILPFTKLHAIMINLDKGYPEVALYPIV
ncbi:MAG: RAD55 family ATPase [Candidatus Helarchaeota archaeon]